MICCDKCITVFSFNGKSYDRFVFENASIFGKNGIEIKDSGFNQKSEFKIRIPSDAEISVKPGDRVIFGNSDIFMPENAYTIMEIKDNRRGNIRHFTLIVK